MEFSIKINWFGNDVSDLHEEELKDHACQRALSMIQEGYNAGELLYEVDGKNYQGWWNIQS